MTTAEEKMRAEFIAGIDNQEFAERLSKIAKELLPNFIIPDKHADAFVKGLATLAMTYMVAGHDSCAAQSAATIARLEQEKAELQAKIPAWQPIETAPKGEFDYILVYNNYGINEVVWVEEYDCWCIDTDKNFHPLRGDHPTHWMPLPPAPDKGQE